MGLVKTQLMGCGCGQPTSGPVWDAESVLTVPETSAMLWQQPHALAKEKLNLGDIQAPLRREMRVVHH